MNTAIPQLSFSNARKWPSGMEMVFECPGCSDRWRITFTDEGYRIDPIE